MPLAASLGAWCSIGLFQRQGALGAGPDHLRQRRVGFQPSPAQPHLCANIAVAPQLFTLYGARKTLTWTARPDELLLAYEMTLG